MALFNKKKLSLDEILNAIANLSEEEKAQIKAKMDEKPEVEEEPKGEEIASETQENEVETPEEMPMEQGEETEREEPVEEPTEGMEEPVEQPEEQPTEQPVPEVPDANVEDNQADVIQGLTDRITALEEQLAQFSELKELMENFTKKQADSFGYKGAIPGAKKDIHDMSASELKEKMLNGEI